MISLGTGDDLETVDTRKSVDEALLSLSFGRGRNIDA
jgi:hypothetical protein